LNGCEVEFELACTAGTYARSLAHDIGADYGCGAHLIQLRRTRSGEFPIAAAVPLSEGEQFPPREFFLSRMMPMSSLLPEIPAIVISEGDAKKLSHGMDLNLITVDWKAEQYRLIRESGDLIALGKRIQAFTSPVEQPAQWVRVHPHAIFV
jgi:tRNA pseudouridine55 synthase